MLRSWRRTLFTRTRAGRTLAGMGVSTRNWAGNQRCVPTAVHEPSSTDEVAAIVVRAAESGQRVKAIGGGHSFTDAAMTDGHLMSLDGMKRVLSVDGADVTVQAGIRLHDLNDAAVRTGSRTAEPR